MEKVKVCLTYLFNLMRSDLLDKVISIVELRLMIFLVGRNLQNTYIKKRYIYLIDV